jgi:hypothetical protein
MLMRFFIIVLVSILTPSLSFGQAGDVPQEYLIKARYLLNMPLFSEIPTQAHKEKSYTICLIGDTPLGIVLEPSRGKLIKGRPLTIRKVDDLGQIDNCQMLFIASSERHRLQLLLPEAHRRGILTVSDMRDFARLGGIVSLQTIDSRILFDLNLFSAGKASISFSSHLLKLARDIIK